MRVYKRLETGVLVDALYPPNAVASVIGDIIAIYPPEPGRNETWPLVAPDEFCPVHRVPPPGADYIVGAPEGWFWAADDWSLVDASFRLKALSEPVPQLSGDALYQMPACCKAAQDPPVTRRPPTRTWRA